MEIRRMSVLLVMFASLGISALEAAEVNAPLLDSIGAKLDFDSPLWAKAAKLAKFTVPVDYKSKPRPASVKTEAAILADAKNVYVLVRAFDANVAKAKVPPPPPDGFLNKFPSGDHVEIVISGRLRKIFAFDMNGNKFSSTKLRPDKYCDYDLLTRRTKDGWEAIATISRTSIHLVPQKKTGKLSCRIQIVRHLDHGGKIERSFAKPASIARYFNVELKTKSTDKKEKK